MKDDLLIQRIALTLIDGVGDVLARQLISYCGSVEGVFREKRRMLEKIPDIGPKTASAIAAFNNFKRAEKELQFVRKHQVSMYFFLDENYPARLKHCVDAPILLYSKGNVALHASRMVAVVGTRNATEYGKSFTQQLVEELGAMKVVVVSGLAYGIDIAAHKACIQHQVRTIGVVAHGLDRIYPRSHDQVARKIVSHGCLVTEHVSGTDPDKENFPKRNRIIAGLCDAVVVVEAAKKGGALITAELANSYNRDVFALPGRVSDPHSEGCNILIKSNRAALIQSGSDIRYIMGWDDDNANSKTVQRKLFVELSGDQKCIYDYLEQKGGAQMDSIMLETGFTQSKIAGILLQLEFDGLVKCLPGKIFRLV